MKHVTQKRRFKNYEIQEKKNRHQLEKFKMIFQWNVDPKNNNKMVFVENWWNQNKIYSLYLCTFISFGKYAMILSNTCIRGRWIKGI